jgi:hypothetical protein
MAVGKHAAEAVIGQPFLLPLHASDVRSFNVEQFADAGDSVDSRVDVPSPLWTRSGLIIVPKVLGPIHLTATVIFRDGTFELDDLGNLDVSVDPSSILDLQIETRFPRLVIPTVGTHFQLHPEITVRGIERPIEISDFATYEIKSADSDAPVTIDSHGKITSVRSGEAIVEVSYAGHTKDLVVLVE